jgi:hypothetical protein
VIIVATRRSAITTVEYGCVLAVRFCEKYHGSDDRRNRRHNRGIELSSGIEWRSNSTGLVIAGIDFMPQTKQYLFFDEQQLHAAIWVTKEFGHR